MLDIVTTLWAALVCGAEAGRYEEIGGQAIRGEQNPEHETMGDVLQYRGSRSANHGSGVHARRLVPES